MFDIFIMGNTVDLHLFLLFFALYLMGNWTKRLINVDTCRGIRIKSLLTLPSTVARGRMPGGKQPGVYELVCALSKRDFCFLQCKGSMQFQSTK